jgi:hypothetical protein
MARLIYAAIASLDGYIEDEDGKFDWAEPDEEVHASVNYLRAPSMRPYSKLPDRRKLQDGPRLLGRRGSW